jgi:hypothetical protein
MKVGISGKIIASLPLLERTAVATVIAYGEALRATLLVGRAASDMVLLSKKLGMTTEDPVGARPRTMHEADEIILDDVKKFASTIYPEFDWLINPSDDK